MRRIVVFGASSAIAEECMRLWSAEPTRFTLVGRSHEALTRIADDLMVRSSGIEADVITGQFDSVDGISATVQSALTDATPDIAMIAFGSLPDQTQLAGDAQGFTDALLVNGVWPSLFAQLVFERMLAADRGHLVLIGSVAGDRGRKSNYAYGSGKAMLAAIAGGMQHAAARSGVRVSLVKPGPTDTPMTRNAEVKGKMATPAAVAATIVKGVDAGRAVIYAPPLWRLLMIMIRALPDPVFNRLNI
jgi:decaprenylphospho-beta-D-erythro-pentofuranosid-2-ulose 2-reductase